MRICKPEFQRIARNGGGLFLGLLFHFPAHIVQLVEELEGTEEEHCSRVSLVVGLIFWRVSIDFTYGYYRRETWMEMESAVANRKSAIPR